MIFSPDAVCSSMTPGSGHVDGCELSRTAQTFIAVLLTEEGKQRSLTDDKDAAPAVSISSVLNAKTGQLHGLILLALLFSSISMQGHVGLHGPISCSLLNSCLNMS